MARVTCTRGGSHSGTATPPPAPSRDLQVWMGVFQRRCLPEAPQGAAVLEVHPGVEALHGPVCLLEAGEAVDEVRAEAGVHVLGGELASLGPVVGPGTPVAHHLLVVA